jgi:predicted aminopeptidase
VYVKGDTMFNESFAVAVEEEGVRRWLARHGDEAGRAAYATMRERRAEFVRLVLDYRARLEAFYREPLADDAKRAGKARLLARMEADYRALKAQRWGGWAGYDRWFEKGVNNAQLASVATYEELVPAFRALLAREGGDMGRFYAEVRRLAQLEPGAREAALAALAASSRAARSGSSHASAASCRTPIAISATA